MHFDQDYIYHIYNRSNETVFFTNDNYLFFIEKIRKHISPVCDILAWCLMPNHFHFLIKANEVSVKPTLEKHRPNLQILTKNFGTLRTSYTHAINKSRKRRGSLFSHKTQARIITHQGNDYLENCFFYIHRNPVAAGLVSKLEDWEYSSFRDYAGLREGTLCNKKLALELINYDNENFYEQSYAIIEEKYVRGFY